MKNNKNGNPVPSIDKNKIEKAFKKEFWNGQFVELHSGDYEKIVEIILELQNGVETNKEQPEIHECEFNGDYMDARCIHCNKPME